MISPSMKIEGLLDCDYTMSVEGNVDYINRIIPIVGKIEPGSLSPVILSLLRLDAMNDEPIVIFVRTTGGSLEESLLVKKVIETINSPVITIAFDSCFSAGTLLMLASSFRCCFENTSFMVHEITMDKDSAKANDAKKMYQELRRDTKYILGLYARASNKYIPWWEKKFKDSLDGDFYFDVKEAKRIGFINGLVFNPKNKFNYSLLIEKFKEFLQNGK